VTGYLPAYALTLAAEPPLYALALRRLGVPARRGYALGLLVNVTSHPLAWLVVYRAVGSSSAGVVAAEAFAIGWEAGLLWRVLRREATLLVALSLLANGASLGLGAALLR
jgi:hypothetical protein